MKTKLLILCIAFTLVTNLAAQRPDWGNTARYAKENAQLTNQKQSKKRVVLIGNSITAGWVESHPQFFKRTQFIGRGISGQTSYQFLLRFRQDVIALNPKIVVINVGTNDIAENTCDYNEDITFANLLCMIELAQAHNIKVILTSVLPAARFGWRPQITDAPQKIVSLNKRIKTYAKAHKLPYIDYYSALLDEDGISLCRQHTKDGVHPLPSGYDIMEKLLLQALKGIGMNVSL